MSFTSLSILQLFAKNILFYHQRLHGKSLLSQIHLPMYVLLLFLINLYILNYCSHSFKEQMFIYLFLDAVRKKPFDI